MVYSLTVSEVDENLSQLNVEVSSLAVSRVDGNVHTTKY